KTIRVRSIRALALAVAALLLCLLLQGIKFLSNRLRKSEEETIAGAFVTEEYDDAGYADGVPVIVLDAGHGGSDPGTSAGGTDEKDLNLTVTEFLGEELAEAGARIYLTRSDDTEVALSDRAAYANELEADLFVSIHCNYLENDASIQGMECYSLASSEEGALLAQSIADAAEAKEEIAVHDTRTANYKVLRETKMTAVLVELGYMSNTAELERLRDEDYQTLLAEAIAEGIVTYLAK
ncbi:MAG: N-acetylmuramoyl-L-alanine amidase, partial [Lachnospiraceae bacterium]|nr:N-acetylmuramoyl-L-alanine amidase [Lachnospiraceae bacterium]